ncbi:GGDEF domain-containing phosphodiesterase [Salinicola halophilus]|uniref:GGDEF domain-containing phosphodiesterase n=1 Tax=Salinicola halophilus TaxID=184065 RepID=UPI000DA1C2AA|nr:GGDEF domain-containing phosphodiesterase [Salinicola halophilus]
MRLNDSESRSERERHLIDQIDVISAQLRQAADGTFDFHVQVDSEETAIQKLAQLNNSLLETARRTLSDLGDSHRQLEARVVERTQRLDLVLTATSDGIWEWDLESGMVTLSARWSSMLGLARPEASKPIDDWLSLIHTEDREAVERALYRHLDGLSVSVNVEYRIRDARGTWRMMLCRGLCQRDEQGRAVRMAGTQTDTTEQRLSDPLTGLPNGDYLNLLLNECLTASPRRAMSLVKFQLLNVVSLFDGVAVEGAVKALRSLVQRLRRQLPPHVKLIALPEHTFAIIFETAEVLALEGLLEPLETLLAQPVEIEGQLVWLSHISGVAILNPQESITVDEWRHQARLALASARSSDTGARRYYSEALRQWERANSRAEQIIRGALATRGVRCFLQPIIEASSGRVQGVEALMRLQDPIDGLVAPAAFIEVAERTGLITPLWEMLMDQALKLLKDPAAAERFGNDFLLSVNLSTRQLLDPALIESIVDRCEREGVAHHRLQIEVTETAVLSEPAKALRILERLRAAGVRVALDDFGSGYSSLAQLTSMPLDTVKIDRELVLGVTESPRKRHVLAAVVALCQRLEYDVVVEGVEDRETLDLLCEWQAGDIQGYYYARPMAFAELIKTFMPPSPHPPSQPSGGVLRPPSASAPAR